MPLTPKVARAFFFVRRLRCSVLRRTFSGLREQQEVEASLRETFTQLEGLDKEVNRWRSKANKIGGLKEKLDSSEKLKAEHTMYISAP